MANPVAENPTSEPTAGPTSRSLRSHFAWIRYLPPVRLTWLFLAGLGAYESYFLLGLGTASLIALPLTAALVDLALQRVRFPRLRFPDAALVTGLFLALLFPPVAPLLATGAVAVATIVLRHALRFRGRPWFNPAAFGVLLGTLLLGLAPAWWVGIGPFGEAAVVALGLLLIARAPQTWRLPAVFLASYGVLAVVQHVVVGTTTDPRLLALQVADPATLFFALFMVAEPRTAPGAAHQRVLYAGTIGTAAAFLPLFLPSLGVIVSLLLGNLLALALRRAPAEARIATGARAEGRAGRGARATGASRAKDRRTPNRWPVAYRVSAAILVLVVLGAVAGAHPLGGTPAPIVTVQNPVSSGGGSSLSTACQSDNPSIPSSELTSLHKLLGPSVILSYDASTGVVKFYDPVNQVTVTEYDLYEDYGFAEFNGDDYAVSGCAP